MNTAQKQFSLNRDSFSREVHAAGVLNHPNTCHAHDVGPEYLVMELCKGETLAASTIELVRKTGISEKARNTGKVLGSQRGLDALYFLPPAGFQVF